jgi:hypothetical protein
MASVCDRRGGAVWGRDWVADPNNGALRAAPAEPVTVVQQCNSDLILEKLPSGSDLMEYTLRMLTSLATSGATP